MSRRKKRQTADGSQLREHLPALPRGWVYFRAWRTARWFVALMDPVLAGVAATIVRGRRYGESVILGLLGSAATVLLFVTLASGVASSNWGTFTREREPIQYWLDVFVLGVAWVFISAVGFFVQ